MIAISKMVNKELAAVEKTLNRTSRGLREVLLELGIDPEQFDYDSLNLDTCDNCNIWWHKTKLRRDMSGNPICGFCLMNCGG